MKKIKIAVIAAVMAAAANAGVSAETENVIYRFLTDGPYETKAALALFEDGALTYCGLYDIEKNSGGEYYVTVSGEDAKRGSDAKIVLFESGNIIKNIIPQKAEELTQSLTPSASPAPSMNEAVSQPTASPENTPPERTFNPVYPKEIDAVSAFAVVKKVRQSFVNDETVYDVEVFYQGEERTLYIKTDVYIASSPDSEPDITGNDVSSLREGDVISIKSSLSGSIKEVVLVMRPPSKSPVLSGSDYGNSFEKLYSRNGIPSAYPGDGIFVYGGNNRARVKYAFGVITDKEPSAVILCGADGKNPVWIDINKNTCVYKIDADDKNETSAEHISALRKSSIPKQYFDEDDNISEWSGECEYNYALVRIVDDTAVDIAYITYGE